MEEVIYKDAFIAIIKKTYSSSTLRHADKIIVNTGDTRYWIFSNDLKTCFFHSEHYKEYGYKSITAPTEGVIRAEFAPEEWYYFTFNGQLLINTAFTNTSEFRGGFAYANVGKYTGQCIIDHSGKLYLNTTNQGLIPIPEGYVDGFALDENHFAFYKLRISSLSNSEGDYYLFDKDINPINGGDIWSKNAHTNFKTLEKGILDWYVVLNSTDNFGRPNFYFNLETNTSFEAHGILSAIGNECLRITQQNPNGEHNKLIFKDGQNFNFGGSEINILPHEKFMLIKSFSGKLNHSYGCLSFTGETILPLIYNDIQFTGKEFIVQLDQNTFRCDLGGHIIYKELILPKHIHGFIECGNRLIVQSHTNEYDNKRLYGVIDQATLKDVLPIQYQSIRAIENGNHIICRNAQYGLLDNECKWLIECKYAHLAPVNDELYICYKVAHGESRDYCIINENDELQLPMYFDWIWALDNNRLRFNKHNFPEIITDYSFNTIVNNGHDNEFAMKGLWFIDSHFHGEYSVYKDLDGKYGIINRASEIITKNKYDSYKSIENSVVYIGKIGNKSYFINPTMKIELEFDFDSCSRSWHHWNDAEHLDLLLVTKGCRKGLIDFNGQIIIDCTYSDIIPYSDHIRIEQDEFMGRCDTDGNIIIPCIYRELVELENGYYIAKRRYYNILSPYGHPIFDECEGYSLIEESEGECLITRKINEKGERRYGLLSKKGKTILNATLGSIGQFKNGESYANYGGYKIERYNHVMGENELVVIGGKWGLLNESGEWTVPHIFDIIGKEANGYMQVGIKSDDIPRYGIFSKRDGLILKCDFSYVRNISENLIVYAIGGEWRDSGLEHEKLGVVINKRQNYLVGAKWGIMDLNGNSIISPFADFMQFISGDLVAYRLRDKYGILKISTNTMSMTEYDYISTFNEGICIVGKYDKHQKLRYGYINSNYVELVPCEYSEAATFMEGKGYLAKGQTTYTINSEGKIINIESNNDNTYYGSDDDYNWEEEAWDFLTGGQYGDYPGGDIDYDFLGL